MEPRHREPPVHPGRPARHPVPVLGHAGHSASPTFVGADSSGYDTAHVFRAAGRAWLLLALDWRTSTAGFAWANSVIKDHPTLPVILTTHEIAGTPYDDDVYPYQAGDPENNASLSSYGQTVWDSIIDDDDQVFLTLNGHYWPPGRTTMKNAAGHDVYVHITNYQNRYFGGGGMLRLSHFDLSRNTIDVETISPWILAQRPEERNVLAAQYPGDSAGQRERRADLVRSAPPGPARGTAASTSTAARTRCRAPI